MLRTIGKGLFQVAEGTVQSGVGVVLSPFDDGVFFMDGLVKIDKGSDKLTLKKPTEEKTKYEAP